MDTPHDGTAASQDHPRQTPDPGSPWEPAPTTAPGTSPYGPPAAPQPRVPVRHRRKGRGGLAAALVAGLAVGGGVVAVHSSLTATASPSFTQSPATGSGSLPAGWSPFGRGRFIPDDGSGSAGSGGAKPVTSATSAQETGVVDIDVVLGGTERAAGTGMVLTSDGEVLTNRHVVEGETSISVTVAATGRTYAANVVGISTTTDVAVVQLVDASGLATVKTSSSDVSTGDAVTGVGNAGGTGGTPSAAPGTVTALDRSITASDADGSNPERLTGLIETDAAIQAGDSGGPLLDSSDAVVGMDSAASAQGNDGYAIPIATALAVAHQIETHGSGTQAGAGTTAPTAHRGYLGVQVEDGAGGALVDGVVQGSPAEAAGIEAGDTITSVAGHAIDSARALGAVTAQLSPGTTVTVTWTDQSGATHGARITLADSAG
jgi:S1-C subfamily serine protease